MSDLGSDALAEMARQMDRSHDGHQETIRWHLQWAASDLLTLLDAGRIDSMAALAPYLAPLREAIAESREFDHCPAEVAT